MMKNKVIQQLSEKVEIQQKIIADLIEKNKLLEKQISALKNQSRPVDICKTCGKLFLFTDSSGCCIFFNDDGYV
jgi:hypothetical protein